MFSERVNLLLTTLHATNTDIAHYAGCDASNISRLHTGARTPKPSSPTVAKFVQGIYQFAYQHNSLPLLCSLWNGLPSQNERSIKTSIKAWLYRSSGYDQLMSGISPKHSNAVYHSFGDKLNAVMNLLDLTNVRLGKAVNLDASYISRFRNGIRIPKSNKMIRDLLCHILFEWTLEQHKQKELAFMIKYPESYLADEERFETYFTNWLCDFNSKTVDQSLKDMLNEIDSLSVSYDYMLPDVKTVALSSILDSTETIYYGTEGFRTCVIRFLGNALKLHVKEILLYTDQNYDWLTKDKEYYQKWLTLMRECMRNKIHFKIIHTIDDKYEIAKTIETWLPLYVFGTITPYCCNKKAVGPFTHTLFLCPGISCIEACHLKGFETEGLYFYHTNLSCLVSLQKQYLSLLNTCEPLFHIYSTEVQKDLQFTFMNPHSKGLFSLLPSLSFSSLPKSTLEAMLQRNLIPAMEMERILTCWERHHNALITQLKYGSVYEFAPIASDQELSFQTVTLPVNDILSDVPISYTMDDYVAHVKNILNLMKNNTKYHFYIIPKASFRHMYIGITDTQVAIMKTNQPHITFIIINAKMRAAFCEYLNHIHEKNKQECDMTQQKLLHYIQQHQYNEKRD